jgi:L-asparaginase
MLLRQTPTNSIPFKATEEDYLGYFIDIKPVFYFPPSLPLDRQYFNVMGTEVLPMVDIYYGHQGLNPALVTASVQTGAKGIVLAGMGAGGWTDAGMATVIEAIGNGTIVVDSHRTQDGIVPNSNSPDGISSGLLNPQKSRIMLQLAINAGYDYNTTQGIFEF